MTWTLVALGSFAIAATLASPASPKLRVTMISIGVTDEQKSAIFYGETLGLERLGNPGEITFFRAGEITIVLNRPLAKGHKGSLAGAVEIVFPAGSVTAEYDRLIARGCRFINEPHQVTADKWAATFTDPDGHHLTLFGAR